MSGGASAAAAMVLLSSLAAADGVDSRYTSLVTPDCRPSPADVQERYGEKGLSVDECPAPVGYRLFVVADDARSWIDLETPAGSWSAEDAIIRDRPLGYFPNVAGSRVAEWRLDATGRPRALIFRVTAQSPESPDRNLSALYIVRLGSGPPCLLGRVVDNDSARRLADSTSACPAR